MRVAASVPADRFDWAPAPGAFSFADVLRHLAAIERWMYGETAAGRPSRYPGHGRELADGPEAVRGYVVRMHEDAMAIFAGLPDERWQGPAVTPAGAAITTRKWLRAMVEHEAHHRGQLYLMLRLCGIETPPIYGLTSEDVRRKSAG